MADSRTAPGYRSATPFPRAARVTHREPPGIAELLALYLDRSSDQPLHTQLADRLWLEILTGTLETGDRLPTARQLAIDLGLNPNTVQRAYDDLRLLGVVVARAGEGTFVALSDPDRPTLERRAQLERLCRDLVAQCEALGVTIDEVVETLAELTSEQRPSGPKGNAT